MKPKFVEERWIDETNYSVAFWVLLPVHRSVKINSDEQHAIFRTRVVKCIEADGGIFENLL